MAKKIAKPAPKVTEEIVTVKRDERSIAALMQTGEALKPQLAIRIDSQSDMDNAVAMVQVAEAWIAKVVALTEPVKKATNDAHKAAVKLEKDLFAVLNEPIEKLRKEIARFADKKITEQRERQRKLDAEQEEKNKLVSRDAVKTAKKAGADQGTLKEIAEAIEATPAPIARPTFVMPAAASSRITYDVDRENFDLFELCLAIVKFPKEENPYLGLIEPNFKALRARAIEGKDTGRIPGFKIVKESGVAIRG